MIESILFFVSQIKYHYKKTKNDPSTLNSSVIYHILYLLLIIIPNDGGKHPSLLFFSTISTKEGTYIMKYWYLPSQISNQGISQPYKTEKYLHVFY